MITVTEADKILAENFAPWVQALGLAVEETSDQHAVLRLPWSQALAREGGALSGQALMAAADSATAIAISAACCGYCPMTTVQQSIAFQRASTGVDVLVKARITKLGRRLVFTDIELTPENSDGPVAHATTIYAFLT
ncbi:PaaI family thioesterase [Streptomyces sp. NPDC057909]|uniref:PaaI family thioesterase n=1 Tax=Streptomyces sp. NPDC057909 TaxID=3346277 RepID=UPI0036EFEF5B